MPLSACPSGLSFYDAVRHFMALGCDRSSDRREMILARPPAARIGLNDAASNGIRSSFAPGASCGIADSSAFV